MVQLSRTMGRSDRVWMVPMQQAQSHPSLCNQLFHWSKASKNFRPNTSSSSVLLVGSLEKASGYFSVQPKRQQFCFGDASVRGHHPQGNRAGLANCWLRPLPIHTFNLQAYDVKVSLDQTSSLAISFGTLACTELNQGKSTGYSKVLITGTEAQIAQAEDFTVTLGPLIFSWGNCILQAVSHINSSLCGVSNRRDWQLSLSKWLANRFRSSVGYGDGIHGPCLLDRNSKPQNPSIDL